MSKPLYIPFVGFHPALADNSSRREVGVMSATVWHSQAHASVPSARNPSAKKLSRGRGVDIHPPDDLLLVHSLDGAHEAVEAQVTAERQYARAPPNVRLPRRYAFRCSAAVTASL